MKKSLLNSGSASARILSISDIVCVLGVIACSLAGLAQVIKYFHGIATLLFAIAIGAFVTLAMLCLRLIHLRSCEQLGLVWLVLPWCLFTLLFVVLFPLAHRHTLGPGSDRDDALRVAASALMHGHYPYRTLTYLDNVITPLRGAILLAVPFFLLGNVSLQNIFWLAMFLGFACWFFRSRSTVVIYVLVLLGASTGNLDDFVVGGDYLVNAMYVCVAFAVVLITHKAHTPLWRQIAAEILLGLAVNSRPVYVVVFPCCSLIPGNAADEPSPFDLSLPPLPSRLCSPSRSIFTPRPTLPRSTSRKTSNSSTRNTTRYGCCRRLDCSRSAPVFSPACHVSAFTF